MTKLKIIEDFFNMLENFEIIKGVSEIKEVDEETLDITFKISPEFSDDLCEYLKRLEKK